MTAMLSRTTRSPERTPPALARCGPDELERARDRRNQLIDSARVLVRVIAHDPDVGDCSQARCGLAGSDHARHCGLAHRLAGVGRPPVGDEPGPLPDLADATRRFETALAGAIDAVRRCRQTEHGAGRCWFATVPRVDGCGEVLRAAHRLG
jgi:hypothetical protein